jgi:hypothetical protein
MTHQQPGSEENSETEIEIWNTYKCRSHGYGFQHPGHIVEGSALSAISLPPHTYPINNSLAHQIQRGLLSSLQIEGVIYACERHQRFLPNGRRAGFVFGDSAGVGKGRQISGILLDNVVRGRLLHVWISASADLYLDATRDLCDIHCNIQIIHKISTLKSLKNYKIGQTAAVLFITYSELVGKNGGRFKELIHFLCEGKSKELFEGCIIFDECHRAKGVSVINHYL